MGKNHYNYINHGKRHGFAHLLVCNKRQSWEIEIHSFLWSQTNICLQIIISIFVWKALVILFLFLLQSALYNRINMLVCTVGQRLSCYGTAGDIPNVASGRMYLRNYMNEIWIKKCFMHYCFQSIPFLRTELILKWSKLHKTVWFLLQRVGFVVGFYELGFFFF